MDLKVSLLMIGVAVVIAIGVRTARASAGEARATEPESGPPDIAPARTRRSLCPLRRRRRSLPPRRQRHLGRSSTRSGLALRWLFLLVGISARLRTFASSLAHGRFYPTLVIYLGLRSR